MARGKKKKISLSFDDVVITTPDFYQGHGHAFESESLIACLPVSVIVDPTTTREELINEILEEAKNADWDIVNGYLWSKYKDEIINLPDSAFREAAEETLRLFDFPLVDTPPPPKDEDEDEDDEFIRGLEIASYGDRLYGYFHVYKE